MGTGQVPSGSGAEVGRGAGFEPCVSLPSAGAERVPRSVVSPKLKWTELLPCKERTFPWVLE